MLMVDTLDSRCTAAIPGTPDFSFRHFFGRLCDESAPAHWGIWGNIRDLRSSLYADHQAGIADSPFGMFPLRSRLGIHLRCCTESGIGDEGARAGGQRTGRETIEGCTTNQA